MKQFAAIMMDHARNTYRFLAFSAALVIAIYVGAWLFMQRADFNERTDYSTIAALVRSGLHLANMLWLLLVLFASGDDDDIRLSLPRYLERLPVHTWTVAGARMLYGLTATCCLAALSTFAYGAFFYENALDVLPLHSLIIIYTTMYAVLQSAAWCFGPAGVPAAIAGVVISATVANGIFFDFGFSPLNYTHYSLPGAVAAIVISYLCAGMMLQQHRKGRFMFLREIADAMPSIRLTRRADAEEFRTKEEALRWYEYRRQWRLFPRILLVVFVSIIGTHVFWFGFNERSQVDGYEVPIRWQIANHGERLLYASMGTMILGTLLAGGIYLFQTWRYYQSKERQFLFIRPATVKSLTNGRVSASIRSVFFGLTPLFVIILIALSVDMRPGAYDPMTGGPEWGTAYDHAIKHYSLPVAVLFLVAGFASLFAGSWAVLCAENFLLIGGVFAIASLSIQFIPGLQEVDPVIRVNYVFRLTSIATMIFFSVIGWAAWKRGTLSVRYLVVVLCLSPILCAGFFFYLNETTIIENEPLDYDAFTTVVPIYFLAIVAPLLTAPLIMHFARHRQ